ncbi:allantoicase [Sugiyamaella lignohabitans]|uniref:allantoicase n=1 Tax=Sugiyamaella lignohabitans TaxID=796027 RepID=A0A161HKQ6_9ASCO|nr:allantoicase [Sugiyamaella lignohabitans]ANB13667.1 allantoicase [Sugiyamaella lignohabitans]
MSVSQVSLEEFEKRTAAYVNVINTHLETEIIAFSDEFFAEATNLITSTPPVREAGRYTEKGAWYDGWETRRHNTEEADWVIIKVGVNSARIAAVEVDTAFFNGNHAPAISVEGVYLEGKVNQSSFDTVQWQPIISHVECGPSQRHFFARDDGLTKQSFNYLRLRMYPDGGIARFRAYGSPVPVFPDDKSVVLDLASISNGGSAVAWSDKRFSGPDNLLLPGRGHDMSDGWETARSRTKGHVDWAIIKLGAPARISKVVVDTAYFLGNFPAAVKVEAINLDPSSEISATDSAWKDIVGETPAGPGKEHEFSLANGLATITKDELFTHVKLVMIPDGGVKRLRIFGTRV